MTARLSPPAPHLFAASACAGLALSLLARPVARGLPLVATVAVLAALVSPRGRVLALALATLAAGAWWGSTRLERLDASALAATVGSAGLATVEVTGAARTSRFAVRVPVLVHAFDRVQVHERARLELPRGRAPPQGSLLELVAELRAPRRGRRGFDEAVYLRRRGEHVVLRGRWYRIVGRRGGLQGVVDRLRERVSRSLAPGLSGERRALVKGVVLGEDEGLEQSLQDAFRASGLYHLLAVSGQNVAYVVLAVLLAAWALGLPRWVGHTAALAAVAAYVAVVGWQPSVVRAGVAGSLASLAWLSARLADRWYFCLLGAALLLAVNPYSALDPGFQLSFAAVAGIFVAVPRFQRRLEGYPLPRRLTEVAAVSAVCAVVTAPVLWVHFGAVPIFSVVANALAAPVVAPMLGFGLLCAALNPVAPPAALALAWVNGWLAAYLAWCARVVGGLPHAQLQSPRVLGAGAGGVLALALARRLPRRRRARLAALAVVVLALAAAWHATGGGTDGPPAPLGLRVTFLDVGQGDATLLEVPEGAVLVDEGPPEAEVDEQLQALGVDRLESVVLTHPQRDHVGGAREVLESLPVGFVLDPGLPVANGDERRALAAARRRRVPVVIARAGQAYALGRLRLRVLWPDDSARAGEDPNAHAVVLLASYGGTDVLLPADAETDVTLRLRLPRVEVLKVAHHGSADDGLPELLARTAPRVAVISAGEGNDYGHPAPSTLAALAEAPDLAVYRTDEDGRVIVESDGARIGVAKGR